MKKTLKVFNEFSKGLNTDLNEINTDVNAALDIDNFVIKNNGTIQKRKGIGRESAVPSELVVPDELKNKTISSHIWENVDRNGRDFLIVQVGEELHFYEYTDNVLGEKIPTVIELEDYLYSDRLLEEELVLDYTNLKGNVIVTYKQMRPFWLTWFENTSIHAYGYSINIRDYVGIPVDYPENQRVEEPTVEHMYNLYNNGWETHQVFYCWHRFGYLPAINESPAWYMADMSNNPNTDVAIYAEAIKNNNLPPYTDDPAEFSIMFAKLNEENYNNKSAVFRKGVASKYYSQWEYASGLHGLDYDSWNEEQIEGNGTKGRVILKVSDTDYVWKDVKRPILTPADEVIDRTKFNDFHLIDNVLDIFLHENKVRMVVELDKEHGMVGGNSETTTGKVSMTINHRDTVGQTKMVDGLGSRIYQYDINEKQREVLKLQKGNALNFAVDEGTWYTDTSSAMHVQMDSYYSSQGYNYKPNSTNEFYSLTRNLSTNPHEYKSFVVSTIDGGAYCVSYNKWIAENVETDKSYDCYMGRHTTPLIDYSTSYPINSFAWIKNITSTPYNVTPRGGQTYYVRGGSVNNTGFNSSGEVKQQATYSHSEECWNNTQFDWQEVKRVDNPTDPILHELKIKDLDVTVEALSSTKCVIIFPISAFADAHPDWLFNVDANGRLICFEDLYKTFKLKLQATIYTKMRSIYENIERDKYAISKLKEEYANDPDVFFVKNIISATHQSPGSSTPPEYDRDNQNIHQYLLQSVFTIELDKPHNKEPFREALNSGLNEYISNINLCVGDYTYYENPSYFSKLYIPRDFIMTSQVNTRPTTEPDWGTYFGDWLTCIEQSHCQTLKPWDELPSFLTNNFLESDVVFTKGRKNYAAADYTSSTSNQNIINIFREGQQANIPLNAINLFNTPLGIFNMSSSFAASLYGRARSAQNSNELRMYIKPFPDSQNLFYDNGWIQANRNRDSEINVTPTANFSIYNDSFAVAGYKIEAMTGFSTGTFYTYSQNGVPSGNYPTSYDYIKTYERKPNLNFTIKDRRHFIEDIYCEFVGDRYIHIGFDVGESFIYDDDTLTTSTEAPVEHPFIVDKTGSFINLHEVKNFVFSINKTRNRAEIMPKFKAYRDEWTWEMDGDGSGQEPIEIDPENLEYEIVNEQFDVACSASFGGRIFYGGIQTEMFHNAVFYSQVAHEDFGTSIKSCYSKNDPTTEYENETLATDGGYFYVDEAETIHNVKALNDMLLIFASNGVWALYGPNGHFDARNYAVRKISNVGAINQESVQIMGGLATYLGEHSINTVSTSDIPFDLIPMDATTLRLDKLWEQIPLGQRKRMRFEYDKLKQMAYVLYSNDEVDVLDNHYKNLLIYNVRKNSFFKFSFNSDTFKVKDLYLNEKIYDEDIRVKLICHDGEDVNIYEFNNEDLYDFDVDTYSASITTCSQIVETPANKITNLTLVTHLKNNPNTSCLNSVDFDFKHSKKKTREIELYKDKPNQEVVFRRTRLMGEGRNFNINYVSPPGKDCEILGFEYILDLKQNP